MKNEDRQKEIESALIKVQIEARETRKSTGRNIIIAVLLAIVFFIIPYDYPIVNFLYGIDALLILFGSLGIAFIWVPRLIQPLPPEYYAFKKIAKAIDVLGKLKERDVAYDEAYKDVRKAYLALNDLSLNDNIAWYKPTNRTLRRFFRRLKGIVLPALEDNILLIQHLEEVALAIYSLNISKVREINATLLTYPSYKKYTHVKAEKGVGRRASEFLRTHNVPKNIAIMFSILVGCGVFYLLISYLKFQRDTALGVSVAAFIGLLAIYAEGRRKPAQEQSRWRDAEKTRKS